MNINPSSCIIIPTYNNEKSIRSVVESALRYSPNVIVVNDGATDATGDILAQIEGITFISYKPNRGKGFALKQAFAEAQKQGFTHAITLDADGQHKASDLPKFAEAINTYPSSLIIGSRTFDQPNMPAKNAFANRFSNFWFTVQTAISLPDTQTGYRAYPLQAMKYRGPLNNRYEAELEMLVRCAWRNISIKPITIDVYYPPREERVSHFRPTHDFARISLLNTVLCFLAILYGYPSMGVRKLLKLIVS